MEAQTEIDIVERFCTRCKDPLVSLIENQSGFCVTCIPLVCQDYMTANVVLAAKDEQIQDLNQARKELADNLQAFNILRKIEAQGFEAATRGLDRDQNPYVDDEGKRTMWEHGWLQSNISRQVGKISAVVAWALNQLSMVAEIARGNGDLEVAHKLQTLEQKLTPIVADALEDGAAG